MTPLLHDPFAIAGLIALAIGLGLGMWRATPLWPALGCLLAFSIRESPALVADAGAGFPRLQSAFSGDPLGLSVKFLLLAIAAVLCLVAALASRRLEQAARRHGTDSGPTQPPILRNISSAPTRANH